MHVAPWVWLVTVGAALAFLALDVLVIGRSPHEPSMKEVGRALSFYVGAAVLFGIGVLLIAGPRYGGEYFAGWLTEYSLSIDNLFIFLIILTKLKVPRMYQQTALLIGIILALVLRGVFIAIGAAAIAQFTWVFYLFGLFLVITGVRLAREQGHDEPAGADYQENRLIGWVRRALPIGKEYNGVRLSARVGRRWVLTPMFIVLVALGSTDLLFALDSIPAVYGLTREPYLVFMVNIFALMGLRQLYFLIGNLLARLKYLSIGLSILLIFIGVKLMLHALHENELPFVNRGDRVTWAPELPVWLSLVVIAGILVVTGAASAIYNRRHRAAG